MENLVESLMNWKEQGTLVSDMRGRTIRNEGFYNRKEEFKWDIEDQLTEQDKLQIIDHIADGLGSYLIETIQVYESDKVNGTIKTGRYDSLHRGSVASWIRKHGRDNVLFQGYPESYPVYRVFGDTFRLSLKTPETKYGYKEMWDGKHVINQWFHLLLIDLKKKEQEYFRTHDEKSIKLNEIESLEQMLWYFDLKKVDLRDASLKQVSERLAKLQNIVDGVKAQIKDL